MVQLLSDGRHLAALEVGDSDRAPALSGTDHGAEHELQHGLLAEGVGDDLEPPPLLDEQLLVRRLAGDVRVPAISTAHAVMDRHGFVKRRDRHQRFPFIEVIFADAGYQGPRLRQTAGRFGASRVEFVRRPDGLKGFAVVAKRWIVERTLAWIGRNRHLARDLENLVHTVLVLIRLATIKLILSPSA